MNVRGSISVFRARAAPDFCSMAAKSAWSLCACSLHRACNDELHPIRGGHGEIVSVVEKVFKYCVFAVAAFAIWCVRVVLS